MPHTALPLKERYIHFNGETSHELVSMDNIVLNPPGVSTIPQIVMNLENPSGRGSVSVIYMAVIWDRDKPPPLILTKDPW